MHPGGLTKTMDAVYISREIVSVYWPLSGFYDLDLEKNVLKARSIKARRKGSCLWKAAHIERVRTDVESHFGEKAKVDAAKMAYERHVATMPNKERG